MFAKSVNRMQIVSVEVLLYQALFLFAGGRWSVALSHNAHAKEAFFLMRSEYYLPINFTYGRGRQRSSIIP